MGKKIFTRDGKLIGIAKSWEISEKKLVFIFPGDFLGMEGREVTIPNGKILYEDNNRIYVEY